MSSSNLMYDYEKIENWRYEATTNTVVFNVTFHDLIIKCAVSREIIEDNYGHCENDDECLEKARRNAKTITNLLNKKISEKQYKDGIIFLP